MTKNFNDFRFAGLDWENWSNSYMRVSRVSDDNIVIRVSENQLQPTRYGAAFILDAHHVVFVKDWAYSREQYGSAYEVVFNRKYYNPREWGDFSDKFAAHNDDERVYSFGGMHELAQEQAKYDEEHDLMATFSRN